MDPGSLRKAPAEEKAELDKHRAHVKVSMVDCICETGKMPLGTRWVDISRGVVMRLNRITDPAWWPKRSRERVGGMICLPQPLPWKL